MVARFALGLDCVEFGPLVMPKANGAGLLQVLVAPALKLPFLVRLPKRTREKCVSWYLSGYVTWMTNYWRDFRPVARFGV